MPVLRYAIYTRSGYHAVLEDIRINETYRQQWGSSGHTLKTPDQCYRFTIDSDYTALGYGFLVGGAYTLTDLRSQIDKALAHHAYYDAMVLARLADEMNDTSICVYRYD